ncbi:MAG: DUF4872 domain-containing protein [bacterium]
MKYLLPGWRHTPGVHCASTALSDVMNFMGHPLDEADCFGLGAGLGFAYFQSDSMSPTRMTATRSRFLEPGFFQNIGQPFKWISEPDPDEARKKLVEYLDRQMPVLLRADIAYLPHYNTSTHFPPHVIVAWGYQDNAVLIADTGWEELLEVTWSDLEKARYGGNAYIKNQAEHFPVQGPMEIPPLKDAARAALARQAKDLTGTDPETPAVFDFAGMKAAAENMKQWQEAPDWQWCARWFYQVIEKRGTGGGAFRLLYSRFLENAGKLDPEIKKTAPAKSMQDIAGEWTELALLLKKISEQEKPNGLQKAAQALGRIREKEMDFFDPLLSLHRQGP